MAGKSSVATIPLSRTLKFVVDNRGKTVPTVAHGIPLIATNCVSNNHLYPLHEKLRYVSQEIYDNWFRAHPQPGDILLTTKGSQNGAVCLVPDPVSFVIAQDMVAVRANEEVVHPLFLFAALRSLDVQRQIKNLDVSGVIPHFKKGDFDKLHLPYPEKQTQSVIGHVYFNLSAKIELNRRMSETLETMARALFQSWFVDFDPIRAKAEGRDPGLPKPLADLFPTRLVDSELGEIPEGWEVACVNDEFNLTMGQSPPGETYNEIGEGMPFYQGRADFESRFPKRRVYCSAPTRLAKAGDTLISVRAPVGDINMAAEDCAIGRGVAAARHKSGSRSYTYQFMRGLEDVFARFEADGTVFGSISKKDFHSIPCLAASAPVVGAFEKLLAPLDSRIEILTRESRTLAALRNALLPKLISGELRVRDAERFIAGTV